MIIRKPSGNALKLLIMIYHKQKLIKQTSFDISNKLIMNKL